MASDFFNCLYCYGTAGLQIFFQDRWDEVTHGAKNGGSFLKRWSQAYQTNHS